ncbi:hypothetical protein PM082_020389 [Marasmius tenuissimus]|nr:hypothetical protein PM082_020389 [Marasmius tenuissimus]
MENVKDPHQWGPQNDVSNPVHRQQVAEDFDPVSTTSPWISLDEVGWDLLQSTVPFNVNENNLNTAYTTTPATIPTSLSQPLVSQAQNLQVSENNCDCAEYLHVRHQSR